MNFGSRDNTREAVNILEVGRRRREGGRERRREGESEGGRERWTERE